MEKWIWIELIGFDKNKTDYAVSDLFSRMGYIPNGVSLLISSADFVNGHTSDFEERALSPMCCSYGGHPCNEERQRQEWQGKDLAGLIRTLQEKGTKVFLSFFNMFSYISDGGEQVIEPFGAAHPELWEQKRSGESQPSYHMLKRFKDGRYYEDFLAAQLTDVLCDYGFDGVQLADGISSARLTVQNGDYSDDMAEQFIEWGGKIPLHVYKGGYRERADYIYSELLEEWLKFLSCRWAEFYKKILHAVKASGKKVLFNSCWTREPFEAYYRYGLDYRKLDLSEADACMIEEVSACMSIYADADQGGFYNSLKDRELWHYEFWAMQLLMKKVMPEMPFYNLSSLKDTNEEWDVLRDAPTEYAKAVYRSNALALWREDRFIPTLSGAFYCLADGIARTEWERIGDLWRNAQMKEGFRPQGFLAVSAAEGLDRELHFFLQTRFYPSHKWISELLRREVPIAGVAEPKDAVSYAGGLLLLYPEYFGAADREKLLSRTDVPIFVITNKDDKEIIGKSDFLSVHRHHGWQTYFFGLHTKKYPTKIFDAPEEKECDRLAREKEGGIWTKKLSFTAYNARFLKNVADRMCMQSDLPMLLSDKNFSTVYTVCTGEHTYRLYVDNRAYYYVLPAVDCRKKVRSVRSLTKYKGFPVPLRGRTIRLRVPNRGIEVVEIQTDR